MNKTGPNGILWKKRLSFKDSDELRSYYYERYRRGGYNEGCIVHGVNVSGRYHDARHEAAERMIEARPTDVILDAGCGSGALAARLAGKCDTLHAVDIAENALNPEHRKIANLRFRAMNIEALDFPDGTFDKVSCVETLEHVLNPNKALREIARVLQGNGRLVVTYPTINRTLAKRLKLAKTIDVSEHLTEWSVGELIESVTWEGFELERVEGIAFDFGAIAWAKRWNGWFAHNITEWALRIRRFPRNSLFVSAAFRKRR